ncbi:hypothetical protein PFISCL1PPCAC_27943, partial [Pristionchus fissidentatus]
ECLVEFTHSAIYDEYDFEGQTKVEIGACSNTTRCALFVVLYNNLNYNSIYDNIQLSTESREYNTTLTELAALRDKTTRKIDPYFLADDLDKPDEKLWFFNNNEDGVTAPLVIYAIDISNWSHTSGVFDAIDIANGVARGKIVTVLSAQPFTVTVAGD